MENICTLQEVAAEGSAINRIEHTEGELPGLQLKEFGELHW